MYRLFSLKHYTNLLYLARNITGLAKCSITYGLKCLLMKRGNNLCFYNYF